MKHYTLIDGAARAAAHPASFEALPQDARVKLVVGAFAKCIFEPVGTENEPPFNAERMWIKITEVRGDTFVGTLSNDPLLFNEDVLKAGDEIEFEFHHVISLIEADTIEMARTEQGNLAYVHNECNRTQVS